MRSKNIVRLLALVLVMLAIPFISSISSAEIVVSVGFAPPALPIYEQPPCPEEGYIWVPGYWAFDNDFDDYFWVPGTWVLAPEVGYFWTPGYWGWSGGQFVFYNGYWGPEVGFYGGINYGFGYFGEGYAGGRWDNGRFFYNRAVTNVNVTNIRNVYNNTTIVNNTTVTRISYNGGEGGVNARPTSQQEAAAHQRHIAPIAAQTQQVQAARSNTQLRASVNEGKPPVAATPRPGSFSGGGVVAARQAGAPYRPPANRGGNRPGGEARVQGSQNNNSRPGTVIHPNDIPPRERPAPLDTGNARQDKKYQQQQEKLQAQQDRERQKLQQRQEQEHQQAQRQADEARKQQMEQSHQQQTQRLQEKQSQQWQKMQEKQRPPQGRQSPPSEKKPRPPQ